MGDEEDYFAAEVGMGVGEYNGWGWMRQQCDAHVSGIKENEAWVGEGTGY